MGAEALGLTVGAWGGVAMSPRAGDGAERVREDWSEHAAAASFGATRGEDDDELSMDDGPEEVAVTQAPSPSINNNASEAAGAAEGRGQVGGVSGDAAAVHNDEGDGGGGDTTLSSPESGVFEPSTRNQILAPEQQQTSVLKHEPRPNALLSTSAPGAHAGGASFTEFAESLAGALGADGGWRDAAVAVDLCLDALVLETCGGGSAAAATSTLVPHPPDRPNSRGCGGQGGGGRSGRPHPSDHSRSCGGGSSHSVRSEPSDGSVSREVNLQVDGLLGGFFEGEAAHDREPFAAPALEGGVDAGTSSAEDVGVAHTRERRESEAARTAAATAAARYRHKAAAAAVAIQRTWRGGMARAEVLERWLAVYQSQRFWRGAVARRRVARMREERAQDVVAAVQEARVAATAPAAREVEKAVAGVDYAASRQSDEPADCITAAARINAAAQRGTTLGAPSPALSCSPQVGGRSHFKKPPLAPRAMDLMLASALPPGHAESSIPAQRHAHVNSSDDRHHHRDPDRDDDGDDDLSSDTASASTCLPEWATPPTARAEERHADLFAEVDALLADSRRSRQRLSKALETKRIMDAMLTPRGGGDGNGDDGAHDGSGSGYVAPGVLDVGVGRVGELVSAEGKERMYGRLLDGGGGVSGGEGGHKHRRESPRQPSQLPPHLAATFEAAYSVIAAPSPNTSPRVFGQHRHPQQQPMSQPSPQRRNMYSDAFATAAAVANSSSTAAPESDAMSQYAVFLAAAMIPSGEAARAREGEAGGPDGGAGGAGGGKSVGGGGWPSALRPVSGRPRGANGSRPGSGGDSGGGGGWSGSRPASPVTPAGISAALRAETTELQEESRFAASLQRVDAQQRRAAGRIDTVVRRYAAAGSVADSPGSVSVAGGSIYSPGSRGVEPISSTSGGVSSGFVDPASSTSSSGRTLAERKPRAVRFKPAKKQAAAMSPSRPESLYGEPPSWSPSAARVLASE